MNADFDECYLGSDLIYMAAWEESVHALHTWNATVMYMHMYLDYI